jgi:hypothetical protein
MQAMGDRIFHMGPLGSSAIIKVITNMLAFIHLKATSEALMLAKRGGLDLAQSWHAIAASSGNSFVHETEGALILNGSYDIAFNIDLALKDLGFALGFGKEFGEIVIACDNQSYWRREYFKYYKAGRKKAREDSGLDWKQIFEALSNFKVRAHIMQNSAIHFRCVVDDKENKHLPLVNYLSEMGLNINVIRIIR